jgi:uncharacterized protein (TIGR02118 family)
MIKGIYGMHKRPDLTIEQLHYNWFENHGPIVAKAPKMVRYVQQITLPEAYDGEPKPTHDGASLTWYEDLATQWWSMATPEWGLQGPDAANWFTRGDSEFTVGIERPVVDGVGTTVMTKAVIMLVRHPALSLEEFQQRWFEQHGALAARLPGLRRYVQNHTPAEAYEGPRKLTLDGWSEIWFDNLVALREAFASPEAKALREDGLTLFDSARTGLVIARERPVVVEPRY